MAHLASRTGVPIYRDHEYRLISVYNNTSAEPQDAMSMLFIYAYDKEYRGSRSPIKAP